MYKTNIFKIYLFFFSIFWILGFVAYPLAEKLHIESRSINFFLFSILFLLNILIIVSFIYSKNLKFKIPKKLGILKILIIVIFFQFISSLLQNDFSEWIPSLTRYLLYLSTFIIFFYALKDNKIAIYHITWIIYILAYIIIGFGYYQILSGNVNFVNNAYRVSGNFTTHHLAFALSSFVILEYLFFIVVLKKENNKLAKVMGSITTLLVLYLFVQSHSRLLLAILVITNSFVFIFYSKKVITKIMFIFISIIFISFFFYIVLQTDLLPRFNEMLTSDKVDSSTLYRLFIIEETFKNMSLLNYIIGIGLGGFNNFFFENTGFNGVAAHNDYLLMLVEGGILSIILYLLYQFLLTKKILTQNNHPITKLSFILFVGIEIFGFLLNPHYFYQSELLIPIVLAILFSSNKGESKNEKNFNVSTK